MATEQTGRATQYGVTQDGTPAVDGSVRAWREWISIPTYPPGPPTPNPMFLQKRVYQGSSGAVYPYRMTHSVSDEKRDLRYEAVFLENDYLKLMLLPALGGRVQMALDKRRDYHFVYYNRVIKPALVGLTGPWIAGGIEFNWPQHHRPTTFSPAEYEIRGDSEQATVWISEWEPMYRTMSAVGFRLYRDRAFLEVDGRVSNPTPFPQTFLWWANPAVAVSDDYQAVFPPDVTAVFDHGKRDMSRFPIATGSYYKVDYSRGVDISWYKNVPVPTSYMAHHSDYNFVGGYDHGRRAGLLHVADHHVSPGKKMWTWGTADFGRAWEANLTDADGPYVELMTGVYTDNQPDFAWLQPGEEKRFTQYFLPYHDVDRVLVASEDLVVGVAAGTGRDAGATMGWAPCLALCATRALSGRVEVISPSGETWESTFSLDPVESTARYEMSFKGFVETADPMDLAHCRIRVYDCNGDRLLAYPVEPAETPPAPKPAEAAPPPDRIPSTEELVLWGRHLEQYRHATFSPEPYYRQALHRDGGNSAAHDALGLRALKRGSFLEAEQHFRAACRRLQQRNAHPLEALPLYHLGLSLWYHGRCDAAYEWFAKAAWNPETRAGSLLYMARIDAAGGRYERAAATLRRARTESPGDPRGSHLLAVVLRHHGALEEARRLLWDEQARGPVGYLHRLEGLLAEDARKIELPRYCLEKPHLLLEAVFAYNSAGFHSDALRLLRCYAGQCHGDTEHEGGEERRGYGNEGLDGAIQADPLPFYVVASIHHNRGDVDEAARAVEEAEAYARGSAFPNQLELVNMLESLLTAGYYLPMGAYELGNFYYAHGAVGLAHDRWLHAAANLSNGEESAGPEVRAASLVHRNLALSFYNTRNDAAAAERESALAVELDPSNPQTLLEYDVLSRRLGRSQRQRLGVLESHSRTVATRDDLTLAYISLLNMEGRHEEALEIMRGRRFHPWEGGEGAVSKEYRRALIELAKAAFYAGEYGRAAGLLEQSLWYPRNLGEGKLPTVEADNEINYWLGRVYAAQGRSADAGRALAAGSAGDETPTISFFYNDRPADALFYQAVTRDLAGDEDGARGLLYKLRDHGLDHLHDDVQIDFFAVSLPDFLVFEEDLKLRNRRFCSYLLALGEWGLGDMKTGVARMEQLVSEDPGYPEARYALRFFEQRAKEAQQSHENSPDRR